MNAGQRAGSGLTWQRNAGFTLIEIMVVVVIIGILAALVVPQIAGQTDTARINSAKTQINTLSQALNLYQLDNFNYPSTEQGLEALVSAPTGFPEAKNWKKEGYLSKRAVPKDPWGNDYVYVSPGVNGPFDLYSLGADGKEGGEGPNADIGSWEI